MSARRIQATVACLLAVAFMIPLPPGAAQIVRQDPPGPFLTGYLGWHGEEGKVSWSAVASEDPGGPGTDTAADLYLSDPVPFELFINASRQIEVDLFFEDVPTATESGTACPLGSKNLRGARLTADGVLVGGVYPGMTRFQTAGTKYTASGTHDPPAAFPPDPPGFGVCRLRFGAEVSTIPAGARLVLRLTHSGSEFPRYGLAGDHASVLRLPVFASEEVPFRHPGFAHGVPQGPGTSAGDFLLRGAGLAGLSLGVLACRRRTAPAIVIVLVLLLAGCTARNDATFRGLGSVEATDGPPSYQRAPGSAPGRGGIVGQAFAGDTGLPVSGAHVALLGTNFSSPTNIYGQFGFMDLGPNEYVLRLDAERFHSLEARVRVLPDLVARVNLTLAPVGTASSNDRPHVHDYWGLDRERTIAERLPVTPYSCASEQFGVGRTPACLESHIPTGTPFGIPPATSVDAYASVLPGADEVNVTVTWDPDLMGEREAILSYQDNNNPSFNNETLLAPRAPGVPFRIATTWEMTDPGHQRFSTWVFRLYFRNESAEKVEGVNLPLTKQDAQRAAASDHPQAFVTIKIRKGVVPFEPAHPDPWRREDRLTVVAGQERRGSGDPVRIFTTVQKTAPSVWTVAWIPTRTIPPDTTWVEVVANASRPLTPSYALDLRFRTVDGGPPGLACWTANLSAPWGGEACDGPNYEHAPPTELVGRTARWTIPVPATGADPYYAGKSFWAFGLSVPNDPLARVLAAVEYEAAGRTAPSFTLEVHAHRNERPVEG